MTMLRLPMLGMALALAAVVAAAQTPGKLPPPTPQSGLPGVTPMTPGAPTSPGAGQPGASAVNPAAPSATLPGSTDLPGTANPATPGATLPNPTPKTTPLPGAVPESASPGSTAMPGSTTTCCGHSPSLPQS